MSSDIFARALRHQCSRFESIAHVCRMAQVNRQQFDKYLTGKMLPNARTMRRICQALGVSEAQLLTGVEQRDPVIDPNVTECDVDIPQYTGTLEMLTMFASQRLKHFTGGSIKSGTGAMPVGHYFCYFPLHQHSPFLLRSLLSIKEKAGQLYFSRRTFIPTTDNGRILISRSKHMGVVLGTASEAYLLGVNRFAPHQLSFITLNVTPVMETRYSGLSLTRKGRDAIAVNTFLHFLGTRTPRRELLKSVGMVPPTDPNLDPMISLLMEASRISAQGQIHALHVDDLLKDRSYRSAENILKQVS